jgi:hypothetical protein
LTEPNIPQTDFLTEFQKLRDELRASIAVSEQRQAEIAAKIAQESVRGTTPNPSSRSNPAQTAQEAVRRTVGKGAATTPHDTSPKHTQEAKIEGDKALYEETLEDIENDNPIEDWELRKDEKAEKNNQGSKRTLGGRIRNWGERKLQERADRRIEIDLKIEAANEKLAKTNLRLAKLNEGLRRVNVGLRKVNEVGVKVLPSSTGKRILDIGIRVLENHKEIEETIKNAPKFGKSIEAWIKETKKEASSLINRLRQNEAKPFFEGKDAAAQKIDTKIGKLKADIHGEIDKRPEAVGKGDLTDEILYDEKRINQNLIDKSSKQIGTLQRQKADLQDSLYYHISKEAHAQDFAKSFQQYVDNKVIPNASEHVGNYLIGTAQERYQHYLYNAVHHLGEKHFDLSFNPKNGLNFDKFASSRLFQDGYHPQEIESVLKDSPFRSIFTPKEQDNTSVRHFYQNWLKQYDRRTDFFSPKNEAIRENVQAFQKEAKGRILEGNVNPHDVLFHENLSEQLKNWQVTRRAAILKEVEHTAREYSAHKGQIPGGKDANASYQYGLEMSRWVSRKKLLRRSVCVCLVKKGANPSPGTLQRCCCGEEAGGGCSTASRMLWRVIKLYALERDNTVRITASQLGRVTLAVMFLLYWRSRGRFVISF